MDIKTIEKLIKEKFEDNGFIKYNNIKIIEVKENYARLEVELDENSLNPNGTAHGGLIFGLADSAMGAAAATNGRNVCTINSQIDYLKAGKGTKLIAEASELKVGKTTAVYRCNIEDENNKLIATCTGTYFFLD